MQDTPRANSISELLPHGSLVRHIESKSLGIAIESSGELLIHWQDGEIEDADYYYTYELEKIEND